MAVNPIVAEIEADLREGATAGLGAIGKIAAGYNNSSLRLLGFLLSLSYEEMRIVTCDPWKRKCGGVPRNSFVIVKVNPNAAGPDDAILANRLILGRVTESVPTPVETDIQSTIFQVHKVQAIVDPLTNKELQWGALKATILGTYYDDDGEIGFGNDVVVYQFEFALVRGGLSAGDPPSSSHILLFAKQFAEGSARSEKGVSGVCQ